ncbi:MAG: hypothetical protein R3F43_14345 [bacterium]
MHIARIHGPGGHRVLAFQGSFHGRTRCRSGPRTTPVKRVPYQIPGYEATFLPVPVADDPYADPTCPPTGGGRADPGGAPRLGHQR